jgi:hypothetical protein
MTLIGDPLYRPFKYRATAAATTQTPKPAGIKSPTANAGPSQSGTKP